MKPRGKKKPVSVKPVRPVCEECGVNLAMHGSTVCRFCERLEGANNAKN